MKTPEEILKNTSNASGHKLSEYISDAGYVWQMIIKAMKEYGTQSYNEAIDDAADNARSVKHELIDQYTGFSYYDYLPIDKRSILKLKK